MPAKQSAYDFMIVGSGAAGGVLAYYLHKGGARVLLLESGKDYRADTFPKSELEYASSMFWGGGVEYDRRCTLAFLRGKCLGGTTVVNQALLDRFDDVAFDDWRADSGVSFLTPDAMEPHYEAVERPMVLTDMPAEDRNRNALVFIKGMEALGHTWGILRRGQSDCGCQEGNDCMACLGGCHRDSKQSTLVAFIQKVEPEGLEVLTEFDVDNFAVRPDHIEVRGRRRGETAVLKTAKLALAAGSFGSTGIMLRSGFKKSLPALGTRFSTHPQYLFLGRFDEPIDAHKGAFQTVKSDDPVFRQKGFKLESVYAPPAAIAMLAPESGHAIHRYMQPYRRYACLEVAVRDESTGEIGVDRKGRLKIQKDLTRQDVARRDEGAAVARDALRAAGALEVVDTAMGYGLHLMGGCPIGMDARRSVVDETFAVHNSPNVYIADSALFPNAPGINPSLTVMALAERLSGQLLK